MRREIFTEIRGAGVACIAKQLGLSVLDWPAPGSITPCPACRAERRGTGDRRGPIGLTREGIGFVCHRCKVSGDALSLAALCITGSTKPDKEGWKQLRSKFIEAELPQFTPPTREKRRPPREEILELWEKSTPVYDSDELVPILEERCLDPGTLTEQDLCRRIKRGNLPSWAVCGRSPWNESGHLCLFPMYDHRGELQSLHARRMAEIAERPKGLSPIGFEIGGLCFADSLGRSLLQGDPQIHHLIIAEGAPDFLTAHLTFSSDMGDTASFGVMSGSWSQDWGDALSLDLQIVIATHHDEAGNRYAQNIAQTLTPNHHARRWRYQDERNTQCPEIAGPQCTPKTENRPETEKTQH